jgi:predicted dehydrogenase
MEPNRYSPRELKEEKMKASGEPRVLSDAGIVADMGSHMLDLLDWFLGPITSVSAR